MTVAQSKRRSVTVKVHHTERSVLYTMIGRALDKRRQIVYNILVRVWYVEVRNR